jgi:uroporphyrinogen decarboxylase
MSGSHRERVQAALSRRQPDRTPVDMMGNASMLLDATYLAVRDYLGLTPIPPVRSGTTANYYDERILDHFGVDFRRVFLPKGPHNTVWQHDDDTFTDAWGVRSRNVGIFVSAVEHPLRHAATLDDVAAYPWPTAEGLHSAAGVREAAYRLYHETDFAVVARNPLSLGFLDRGCNLMGMAEFLMLMIDAPAVADAILDHILEIYMGVYRIFLEAAGPYVQVVEVADDLGGARSPLVSPAMYRRFIKPREHKLYAMIRELAPEAFIIHHTDGNVFAIIPDLIEVGVNVLNPVQTSSRDMGAEQLKGAFGDRLAFHGAIEGMEGDKDALVAEVKARIDVLGRGGGYVMASCNHMIDVAPENVEAMFETAASYRPWETGPGS